MLGADRARQRWAPARGPVQRIESATARSIRRRPGSNRYRSPRSPSPSATRRRHDLSRRPRRTATGSALEVLPARRTSVPALGSHHGCISRLVLRDPAEVLRRGRVERRVGLGGGCDPVGLLGQRRAGRPRGPGDHLGRRVDRRGPRGAGPSCRSAPPASPAPPAAYDAGAARPVRAPASAAANPASAPERPRTRRDLRVRHGAPSSMPASRSSGSRLAGSRTSSVCAPRRHPGTARVTGLRLAQSAVSAPLASSPLSAPGSGHERSGPGSRPGDTSA